MWICDVIASNIKFVFQSSTITMMHGPINIRFINFLIFCWPYISIYLFININQLDALNFILSLFQASTCFEHMCSSSGGQILMYSLWYHHTYKCDDTRDFIIQYRCDDTRECIIHLALLTMSTCPRIM